MKGKKYFLSRILYHFRVLRALKWAARNKLIIFNYHRIRPNNTSSNLTSFDEQVFGPVASTFKNQIKWLRQHTQILSEAELINILETKRFPHRVCSLITFDDGYRDNYSLAYPILKELGVRAVFFIPTYQINTRQLGWWDIIAYLMKNTPKEHINFEGTIFSLPQHRQEAITFFLNKMKLEPYYKTETLLTKLARLCEVPFPSLEMQDSQLMTWDQIRELSKNNFSIGSHTHTHRVLASISPRVQKEEGLVSY